MDDDDAKRKKKKSKMWVERKENCCRRRRRAYIYIYIIIQHTTVTEFCIKGNEKFLYIFCMYTYWNVLRLTHFNMNLK